MKISLNIGRLLERVGLARFVKQRMTQVKRLAAAAAAASALLACDVDAADISWQIPDEMPLSASLSTDGMLIEAVNLVSDDSLATGVTTVSGIDFTNANLFGNGYAGIDSLVATGDVDLDTLYQSFGYTADAAVGEIAVSGLSIGEDYLVQVLFGDDRGCCSGREVAAGTLAANGTQTTPVSVSGGVLFTGSFTADADSQTFFTQLSNGATGFEMAAYQVRQTDIIPPDLVLTLTANTENGDLTISNGTANPVMIDSYQIASASDSLDFTGWESFADRSVPLAGFPQGTGSGNGWESGPSVNDGELVEWYLDDEGNESSIAVDQSISLGAGFDETSVDRDLLFTYRDAMTGSIFSGLVAYEGTSPTGVAGDFNGDDVVNLADYTVWRDNLGGDSALPNDNDLGTPISTAHYDLWKLNFGQTATSGALVGAQTVPEPTSVILLFCACLGSLTLVRSGRRGIVGAQYLRQTSEASRSCLKSAAICCVAWAVMGSTAQAAFTLDREYLLGEGASLGTGIGDVSENGSAGAVVGANVSATGGSVPAGIDALDSAGEPATSGTYVALEQFGNPQYVNVNSGIFARPGTSPGDTGVQFDASSSQYLSGLRLGFPETSVSSSANGGDPPGPIDYSGIANRGFQLWARPGSGGSGTVQSLVADTLQHGVRISATNNWVLQYAGGEVESSQSVQFDSWSHVMVVRPFGGAGGARMYVNGEVVAVAGGDYGVADNTPLILGANSGDMPGMADFYTGVLDDLEMFVLGTSSDTAMNYGTFDLATDNEFIADALAGMTQGDLTDDGIVNDDDVSAFLPNWLTSYNPIAGSEFVGGDLNSRDLGDFNLDGVVNLTDAFILNRALGAAGAGSLNFALLGGAATEIPEPMSMAPACIAAAALLTIRRRSVA